MQQDSELIRIEIKNYEQRLQQNPDSYVFARLSEDYLKMQQVDDALQIARQGVARHPAYVAGQRALAMACNAKGLDDECLEALHKVADSCPDDLEVQKLFGRLLAKKGDHTAAQKAFNTVLEFSPDDEECRIQLNSFVLDEIQIPAIPDIEADFGFRSFAEEDEIIELSEADIIEEEAFESATASGHDPLETATLAELYVKQGFKSKAIDIYRSILADNPFNSSVRTRLEELEAGQQQPAPATEASLSPFTGIESQVPEIPSSIQGVAAAAVETLEGWLVNIRRIKACR